MEEAQFRGHHQSCLHRYYERHDPQSLPLRLALKPTIHTTLPKTRVLIVRPAKEKGGGAGGIYHENPLKSLPQKVIGKALTFDGIAHIIIAGTKIAKE